MKNNGQKEITLLPYWVWIQAILDYDKVWLVESRVDV